MFPFDKIMNVMKETRHGNTVLLCLGVVHLTGNYSSNV